MIFEESDPWLNDNLVGGSCQAWPAVEGGEGGCEGRNGETPGI